MKYFEVYDFDEIVRGRSLLKVAIWLESDVQIYVLSSC